VTTRRVFLGTLVGGAIAAPSAARAQAPPRIPRIGFLGTASLDSPEMPLSQAALREGLRERGYVEGQNIAIEYRLADGNVERFPALAAELVQAKVDIILASNTRAGREAQRATRTIPIVVAVMGDPVGDGLVQSLSKPGGNLTGSTFLGPELVPKRLALLKEALPRITKVAGLWHPGVFGERTNEEMRKQSDASARSLKVQLQYVEVWNGDQLDRAFATMAKERVESTIVFPSPLLFNERRAPSSSRPGIACP
jgi:putative ABC transport system substrate-binding protein